MDLGVSTYFVERMNGLNEKTRVRVRTAEGITEEFCVSKGLTQGCVLSTLLFPIACIYSRAGGSVKKEILVA